ncbi:probable RNA-directed DNA polymerase from transposon BS [Trichonephila clavipes]|nr:probable RNA-directed DNA polymerase from transposon BS [Trichonephila clavipes]
MENNICNSMILTSRRRHFYLVGQSKHKVGACGVNKTARPLQFWQRSSDEEISSSESESDDDCLDSARDWCQIDVTSPLPSYPKFPFTGNPGIKVCVGDSGDPFEYFNLFLDDEMFSFIVEETNRYAESFFENAELTPGSRAVKWKNTNKEEMKRFIARLLLQGVVQKPVEQWFWSKRPSLSTPFFGKVMGELRFGLLMKFLHFVNIESSSDLDHNTKLKKIREFHNLIVHKFKSVYVPKPDISVDESLIAYKGRLSWKQYIPQKRARFGIKLFQLCESESGYIWNYIWNWRNFKSYWFSNETDRTIDRRRRIRFTNLCHEVEEVISSCKRKKWTEFCETLDPQKISQHWKVIKTLNNQSTHQKADIPTNIISSSGRDAATNKETASLLAKHYENKSKLTFNANDRKLLRTYRKTIQDSKRYNHKNIFTIPFLMEELEAAIAKMNPGKAPGPDVIFGRMVQHFGNLAKKELLEIFNLSWATGKLPKIWKLSTVIPILKPNKNASECKNYRPISLTSTLCKLMERIIHRRLMNWLIENKKLHFYQTAFRIHHSTTDQLFYLIQSIIDGFQEKPHKKTLAVFLDISAAFDRVWRQKLVHTIQGTGINGKALLWINDFLRGRKFSVRFNGALSESRRMWAGVPQGSVLSPLLFLIFMNTIHHHIHPDTNIACYADDIAIWHSHNDITESEKALNTTLKGIAEWAENLKLTINADKTNYCIFSTDRRHRSSFNANIKIQNSQIKKVDLPTYLGVTLDPELRFSKHIEQTTNKALGKLNILRKLCGTSWGSRPQTLKSTFCTVIRPVLEYATPIWTPASISVKRKLDSVQHRAAKIIIGAVSSTNNEKAEQECGLPPLESRRKLATIKFTNKLRSYGLDHISRRVFDKWKHSTRLKRSSTLQLDSEFRKELNLDHSSLEFLQEPLIPKNPPKNTGFELELLQPCSKKEDPVTLRQKGLETIAILSQDNFAIAYTDGSSDRSLSNGGAGIILLLPDGNNYKHKINTGIIASNFTSELVAIREALLLYQQNPHVIDSTEGLAIFSDSKSAIEAIRNGETNISCDIITLLEQLHNKRKSCILQWIPAHVNIEGNECADSLAKEARDIEHKCTTITLDDANAVAKHRIMNHTFKNP